MSKRIVIDPVSRIEGHAKITVHVDDAGKVTDARFHVTEFRGFEKFCEGRSFREMPAITSRICGICPVSHLICSAKTGDALLATTVPPAAANLRRMMNYGQIIQSHALSFFHLSGADLFLGHEWDPATRNMFGLLKEHPDLVRDGIGLRKFGQEVIEILGGKRIHTAWAVPGGVNEPFTAEHKQMILDHLPNALAIAQKTLSHFKSSLSRWKDETETFGDFPSLFLGLVTPTGGLEHYDGKIRIVDSNGAIVADQLDPAHFEEFLGEAVESWSYLKFPYYRPAGYPDGVYRVGPLARLNIAAHCGTQQADAELREFKQLAKGAVSSSFHFHYARLIEILFALERIDELTNDPVTMNPRVRAQAELNANEGVGCSEAPRGTLFHHYRVNDNGVLTRINLLIATGQNNLAMNRTIRQIADRYVNGDQVDHAILNRLEAGIRAFDPCLSCSTHALGRMPLHMQIIGPDGAVRAERSRGSDGRSCVS